MKGNCFIKKFQEKFLNKEGLVRLLLNNIITIDCKMFIEKLPKY
jgi:hypothetical protein